MSLPSTARVVIIGGGVVGTSALYHLARAGWSDCVLLEKSELTAGSTWHAAGNCPNFAPDYGIMKMQSYGLALYRGLAEEVDYPINYHVTGAVRLAHSEARMMEFERVRDRARLVVAASGHRLLTHGSPCSIDRLSFRYYVLRRADDPSAGHRGNDR